jgi:hypothetical protein
MSALANALAALERAFDAALEAALPNPVALRFTDLALGFQGKRDLVFALDLVNEGENEAALIAGLAGDALARDPAFDIAHLEREAWYYLRTSIDPTWQFDDAPRDLVPALAYVEAMVAERVARVRRDAGRSDEPPEEQRRAALERCRATNTAAPRR